MSTNWLLGTGSVAITNAKNAVAVLYKQALGKIAVDVHDFCHGAQEVPVPRFIPSF